MSADSKVVPFPGGVRHRALLPALSVPIKATAIPPDESPGGSLAPRLMLSLAAAGGARVILFEDLLSPDSPAETWDRVVCWLRTVIPVMGAALIVAADEGAIGTQKKE